MYLYARHKPQLPLRMGIYRTRSTALACALSTSLCTAAVDCPHDLSQQQQRVCVMCVEGRVSRVAGRGWSFRVRPHASPSTWKTIYGRWRCSALLSADCCEVLLPPCPACPACLLAGERGRGWPPHGMSALDLVEEFRSLDEVEDSDKVEDSAIGRLPAVHNSIGEAATMQRMEPPRSRGEVVYVSCDEDHENAAKRGEQHD